LLTPVRFGTEEEQVLLMETALMVRGWSLRDGRGIRAVARETGGSVMNSVYLVWPMRVSDTVTH